MKFHEDTSNGFKVTEQTRFCLRNCYLQSSKGHNSKSINTRDMVLAFYMSSNVNICMKFHEDILNGFQVIERTLFYFFILTDISNYRADTIDVWGDVKRYVSPYINYSAVYILFWSFEISDRNK